MALTKVFPRMVEDGTVNIKDFGAVGDGSTDDTAAIQDALTSAPGMVIIPEGTFIVSSVLVVPEKVEVVGFGRKSILQATSGIASVGGDNEKQMVHLDGDRAGIRSVSFDGQFEDAGGVSIGENTNHCFVTDCFITSCLKQGVLAAFCDDYIVSRNIIEKCQHGVQNFRSSRGVINDNNIRYMDGAAIWAADGQNLVISGNYAQDCGDVGLDLEGGINCNVVGNTVTGCKNGELAWFKEGVSSGNNPQNCLFSGNTLHRTATYNKVTLATGTIASEGVGSGFGSIHCYSVNFGQENISFANNNITVDSGAGYGIATNEILLTGKTGFSFVNNTVVTAAGRCMFMHEHDGTIIKDNLFHVLSGGENQVGVELKNQQNCLFENNVFKYDVTKTTNYALLFNTDTSVSTETTFIKNNVFINCSTFCFQHDPFNSGAAAILAGNDFGTFTSNGGVVSTANGGPMLKGQNLKFFITNSIDFTNVTALRKANHVGAGTLHAKSGGGVGAVYDVFMKNQTVGSAGGSGSGSGSGGLTSTTTFATFSGTTITMTGPSDNSGFLTITYDNQ